MSTTLITGSSGLLGSYAATRAAKFGWTVHAQHNEHATELPGCHMVQLDIRSRIAVRDFILSVKPDSIIHTAAIRKLDPCEENKPLAYDVNVNGTFNLAVAANEIGAHMVFVSTDTVFDGRNNPYTVDDPPSPCHYYGFTKTAAETAMKAFPNSATVRTSVIYGPSLLPHLESFSDEICKALRAGKTFQAYADQIRAPIPAWNLADALLEIAERKLNGIFHCLCPQPSTRFQFACKIAEVFGYPLDLIQPIFMSEIKQNVQRSNALILDTSSTVRKLNTHLANFEEGIMQLRERY
jgi:dTDP-4-dehydrorhamnose reductase